MKYLLGRNQRAHKSIRSKRFFYNVFNAIFNKTFILLMFPLILSGHLSAEVTPSGAFTTSLPIKMPAGISPIAPSLALSYSSQFKGKMVGRGWSFTGLSAISRTKGEKGIRYSGTDSFAHSGVGELVDLGDGTYHSKNESFMRFVPSGSCGEGPCSWLATARNGTQFSYGVTADSRVKAVGKGGSVRVWALNKVVDLEGNSYTVSYTSSSTSVGSFVPDTIVFPGTKGVTVEFSYIDNTVAYTTTSQNAEIKNTDRLQKISIKHNNNDAPVRSYRLTYNVGKNGNCSKLQTSLTKVHDQLNCFAEYGDNDTLLNTQRFGWTVSDSQFIVSDPKPGSRFLLNVEKPLGSGDYNGDGYLDFMTGIRQNVINVHLNDKKGSYEPPVPFNVTSLPGTPKLIGHAFLNIFSNGDYNGDGKTDFIATFRASNGRIVQQAFFADPTGSGSFVRPPNQPDGIRHPQLGRALSGGDYNGDGLSDFISGKGVRQWVNFSNGDGTFKQQFIFLGFAGTVAKRDLLTYKSGDFNGDGMTDFIAFRGNNKFCSNSSAGVNTPDGEYSRLFLSNIDELGAWSMSTPSESGSGLPGLGTFRKFAGTGDFNGDGLTDYMTHHVDSIDCNRTFNSNDGVQKTFGWLGGLAQQVHLSTGDGFATRDLPANSKVPDGYLVVPMGDLNGDNLADLFAYQVEHIPANKTFDGLARKKGGSLALLSNGDGSFIKRALTYDDNTIVLAAGNLSGNGRTELIMAKRQGFQVIPTAPFQSRVSLINRDNPKPHLLNFLDNGLRGTTNIEYKAATRFPAAIRPQVTTCGSATGAGYGAPCGNANPSARSLVSSVSIGDGTTSDSGADKRLTQVYDYINGRYFPGSADVQENLGFEKTSVSNYGGDTDDLFQLSDKIITSTYRQDIPFQGRLAKREIIPFRMKAFRSESAFSYESVTPFAGTTFNRLTGMTDSSFTRTALIGFLESSCSGCGSGLDTEASVTTTMGYGSTTGVAAANVTSKTVSSTGVDTVETVTKYRNNESDWLLGRVDSVETLSGGSRLSFQEMTYDSDKDQLPSTSCDWLDTTDSSQCTTFSYNANGTVKSSADFRGGKTSFEYKSAFTNYLPTKVTNSVGHVVKTGYNKFGLGVSVTDANSNKTTFAYDEFGRLKSTKTPDGVRTQTFYHNYGRDNQRKEVRVLGLRGKSPSGSLAQASLRQTTINYFDGSGFVYKTHTTGENTSIEKVRVINTKDALWRPEKTSQPFFVPKFNSDLAPTDWTTTTYYADGRVSGTIRADGEKSTMISYNKDTTFVTKFSDFEGNKATTTKDALGRIISVQDEVGTTLYENDPLGRLLKITVAAGTDLAMETTITYDSFGRKTSIEEPNTGNTTYSYNDRFGNQAIIYADGSSTTTSFDLLGRPTFKNGLAGGIAVMYIYDNKSVSNGIGQLTTVLNGFGGETENYQYDEMGNLTKKIRRVDNKAYTFNYEYKGGRLSQTTYPDGSVVKPFFSSSGKLYSMELNGAELASWGTNYNAFGQTTEFTNGPIRTEFTYDPQLNRMTGRKASRAFGSPLVWQDLTYSYYDQGNLSDITDNRANTNFAGADTNATESFVYDDLYRLTSATGAYPTRTYAYDVVGNMTDKAGKNLGYKSGTNQPETSTNSDFSATYDLAGNMSTKTLNGVTYTYTYNIENRLIKITGGNKKTSFVYDSNGQRLKKEHVASNAEITTTYYIDAGFEVTVNPDDSRDNTLNFFGNGGLLSSWTHPESLVVNTSAETLPLVGMNYFIPDHIGSNVAVVNGFARLASRSAYLPYGKDDASRTRGENATHHKFTEQEFDAGSGLYYYNARYYDPEIGSFITADRFVPNPSDGQSYNRYSYVRNNPVMRRDPTGNFDSEDANSSSSDPFGLDSIDNPLGGLSFSPGADFNFSPGPDFNFLSDFPAYNNFGDATLNDGINFTFSPTEFLPTTLQGRIEAVRSEARKFLSGEGARKTTLAETLEPGFMMSRSGGRVALELQVRQLLALAPNSNGRGSITMSLFLGGTGPKSGIFKNLIKANRLPLSVMLTVGISPTENNFFFLVEAGLGANLGATFNQEGDFPILSEFQGRPGDILTSGVVSSAFIRLGPVGASKTVRVATQTLMQRGSFDSEKAFGVINPAIGDFGKAQVDGAGLGALMGAFIGAKFDDR